jgi:hypothetical protein
MKHKHAEVAHAFIDGKECEYWYEWNNTWEPISHLSYFNNLELKVRVKPEQEEPQYLYVYNHTTKGKSCMSTALIDETYGRWKYMGKVKVEK